MEFAKSKYATWYQRPEWKQLREAHLKNNWKCIQCESTVDLHVDHIIDFEGYEPLFLEIKNLQTLCRKCHFHKTNIDNLAYSKPIGVWRLTVVEKDEDFPYTKEKEEFGINNVIDRYVSKIVAEGLVKPSIEVNAKLWTPNELRLIFIRLTINAKSMPKDINGERWAIFWTNYYKGIINKPVVSDDFQNVWKQQEELRKQEEPVVKCAPVCVDISDLWNSNQEEKTSQPTIEEKTSEPENADDILDLWGKI